MNAKLVKYRLAVRSPQKKPRKVLNFDVNNTIVMLDSATGADSKNLIAMVLSNSAWGSIDYDGHGKASWTCRGTELCTSQPEPGLHTFTEFVVLRNPFPNKQDTPHEDSTDFEVVQGR